MIDDRAYKLLAEGKTKKIFQDPSDERMVIIHSKEDITAGDGAKHDVIPGKGEWATTTTCNVFRMLKRLHNPLPLAFIEQADSRSFLARRCTMLPFEVVIRRAPYGSYLKRHPEAHKGEDFAELKCEFFLKTTGKRFKNYGLPVDDPLIILKEGMSTTAHIYHPAKSANDENAFLLLIPLQEIIDSPSPHDLFLEMERIAKKAFLIIEEEVRMLGGRLVDLKVEFGIDQNGNLLLADVVDNDSWRLLDSKGNHLDKQLYRDGKPLEEVAAAYKLVADLTSRFT